MIHRNQKGMSLLFVNNVNCNLKKKKKVVSFNHGNLFLIDGNNNHKNKVHGYEISIMYFFIICLFD